MDKVKDQAYISHILDAARLIKEFIAGKNFQEFQNEPMRYSAVIRQFEIIGEAATEDIPELEKELEKYKNLS